jgi:hypothetical protein
MRELLLLEQPRPLLLGPRFLSLESLLGVTLDLDLTLLSLSEVHAPKLLKPTLDFKK